VHNKSLTKVPFKTPSGITIFSLYDDDIGHILPVTEYMRNIANSTPPKNTIINKGSDIVRFFSYLLVFDDSFFTNIYSQPKSSTVLYEIITQYPEYLTIPHNMCSGVFSKYASQKNKNKIVQQNTAARYLSTVNEFLEMSSIFHETVESMKAHGYIDIDTDKNVFKDILSKRKLSASERIEISKRSVLASVIRGGSKYASGKLFKAPRTANKETQGSRTQKSFPVKYILELVNSAPNLRDKLLWCLLAGTGIRVSEALQVLLRDIDIENEQIFAIDPSGRKHLFYGIPQEKIDSSAYKSRVSPVTYFINPFRDIFFSELQEYFELRKKLKVRHELLFVSTSNQDKGQALIGSTEMNESFKKNPNNHLPHTIHSLRHFYGVWCRNFIKRGKNKYGFPIATVNKLMGHKSASSTDIYAIKDEFLLQAEIQYANELISGSNTFTAEENVKKALTYRLTKIEERILGISEQ
jgi:integrase